MVALVAAMLVVLSVSPEAFGARSGLDGAQDERQFTWSFRCDGVGGVFPVDAETVRTEGKIPAEFHLRGEATGTASLFLAAFDCDPAIVDGAAAPFLYALATVDLDPFAGRGGSYDFFKFTDATRVHTRFEQMGVWIRELPGMSVGFTEVGGVPLEGRADVSWGPSPFNLTARSAPGAPLPDDIPSDHWSYGQHGTVYGADNNCEGRAHPALVTADTTPGTTIARILGGDRTAPGVFLHLSAAGHVAFEGQTQRPKECPTWD